MLRILKQNDLLSAITLVLLCLLLKGRYVWHPLPLAALQDFDRGLFFTLRGLPSFYVKSPALYTGLSVLVQFGLSLYINYIVNREKLQHQKSYLPAFTFLLYTSFVPILNVFSTLFIANTLLFIAFGKTLQLYHMAKVRKECFDIGLLLALACLFYSPAILFVLLFAILLFILRPFSLQELTAFLLGCFTLLYVSAALLFLFGKENSFLQVLHLQISLPVKTIPLLPLITLNTLSICMVVYSIFLLNQNMNKFPMAVRKKWTAVSVYLGFATLAGLFSSVFPGLPWLLVITPLCIILSTAFQHDKEKNNTFTFYFLLLSVLAVQWLFKY